MASVYVTNRHNGEKTLLIDGLTQEQAQEFAGNARTRYTLPELIGTNVWQGFDITIEPDAFDPEEVIDVQQETEPTMTLAAIETAGGCYIREYYPFGKCDTYRLPDGSIWYAHGDSFVTWQEKAKALYRNWVPVASDDIQWWQENVEPYATR